MQSKSNTTPNTRSLIYKKIPVVHVKYCAKIQATQEVLGCFILHLCLCAIAKFVFQMLKGMRPSHVSLLTPLQGHSVPSSLKCTIKKTKKLRMNC